MLAKALSSAVLGIEAYTVKVEAHLENVSPSKFFTVGLPEGALKESKERVLAAMNPCPCGYFTDPKNDCTCNEGMIQKYLSRISGPLLDRIDIHLEVPAVAFEELADKSAGESSASINPEYSLPEPYRLSALKSSKSILMQLWKSDRFAAIAKLIKWEKHCLNQLWKNWDYLPELTIAF